MIDLLVGLALAAATIMCARMIGFDRDRAFYPVVLIVIALLYVLFGAIDGHIGVIAGEVVTAAVFSAIAIKGYKGPALWLVVGYALHGM